MEMLIKTLYRIWPWLIVIGGATALPAFLLSFRSKSSEKNDNASTANGTRTGNIRNRILLCSEIIIFIIGCLSGYSQMSFAFTPNVVGDTIGEAKHKLTEQELEIGLKENTNEPDMVIVSQSPNAGTLIRKGSTVEVIVNAKTVETIAGDDADGENIGQNESATPELTPPSTATPTPPPTSTLPPTPTPTPTPAQVDFSVSASYRIIPFSFTDKNCEISAYTSMEATRVTVVADPNVTNRTYEMTTSDYRNWSFNANFDTPGTYTVTVTAYRADGTEATDSFSITYPFFESLFN